MMLREFRDTLQAFGREEVERVGGVVFQEAAQVAAEAVVIGNAYGLGAPLDTGFLRASFRVARNAPEDGPSVAPTIPGRQDGDPPVYPAGLDTSAAAGARLGDTVWCTTMAAYAQYLEDGGFTRRNGPDRGAPTLFVAPVEARWVQIVDDTARRVGYGR